MNGIKSAVAIVALIASSSWNPAFAEKILLADHENGRRAYQTCSICHKPEGWGTEDGMFPQIAGQHRSVIIKQLEDIRSHKRENVLMDRFAAEVELSGAQDILNVATYISELPMTPNNGKGPGDNLKHGQGIYRLHCLICHGLTAEGNAEERVPLLAGQHFLYLEKQFESIRDGRRGNADPDMIARTKDLSPDDTRAVLDYISRLSPPAEKVAPADWKNREQTDYTHDLSPGLKF